jgi:hypothetical protein
VSSSTLTERAERLFGLSPTRDLVAVARGMFPHRGLSDAPYERSVAILLEQAATSPLLLHVLLDGLAELRAAVAEDLSAADEQTLFDALADRQSTPFFIQFRSAVGFSLYDDREVWAHIGYPGPSFHLGGYLNRGFNDLSWLPEPRVEESDLPFTDIGPLQVVEREAR